MSPLTAAILDRIQIYPLSLVELMEDLGLNVWEKRELMKALRQLEASGLVCRLEAPGREEHPFYGRSLTLTQLSESDHQPTSH